MRNALRMASAAPFMLTAVLVAQDPTKTLPDAYKVQFENDHVRVVRVHYAAGAKLADHAHAAGTTIYVYLNDSDGVVFKHSSGGSRAVTRPPVKAGAIRIATGPEEHHTAENNASSPSDFLRIWLKTESAGARSMRRIPPAERQYANKQVRVTRLKVEQHESVTVDAKEPALVVEWPSGTERWIEAGKSASFENHEPRALELIRFDFLTPPAR